MDSGQSRTSHYSILRWATQSPPGAGFFLWFLATRVLTDIDVSSLGHLALVPVPYHHPRTMRAMISRISNAAAASISQY